jgi:hypothetical protein
MIKSNSKVYGEINDANTLLSTPDLGTDKYVVGSGNKGIKTFTPGANQLLIVNADGTVSALPLGVANKTIATDGTGTIVLIDKET